MELAVPRDSRGMIPDTYAKYADQKHLYHNMPTTSFPFEVRDIPDATQSLALTFTDYDSIPVCGFTWIHWLAAGIDGSNVCNHTLQFPEDASNKQSFHMVQGTNSSASSLGGSVTDPLVTQRYNGPQPPDKTHIYTLRVYALTAQPHLQPGFLLNELVAFLREHTIESAEVNLPARA